MPIKILGIHGLGKHDPGSWEQKWIDALHHAIPSSSEIGIEFIPFNYDEIYERVSISPWESLTAFAKLAGSGITSGWEGLFGRREATRGIVDSSQNFLRWYAGYVVAWLEDDEFRRDVRERLLNVIGETKPDVILAHSLGSLISYDAFSDTQTWRGMRAVKTHMHKMTYVTLGSQIGNLFVRRNLTPGRISPLDVQRWVHLFNPEDDVFTAEIELPGVERFLQIETFFDIPGWTDHEAVQYLTHERTVAGLWSPLVQELIGGDRGEAVARTMESASAPPSIGRPKRRRALLVGINEYPNPRDQLAGCVNDVFLMSSVLQECGFQPDQIRVVLNERATANGILDRLNWLLDDAGSGDELFFYYSGHGAQLPTYGLGDAADRMDETLVPYDFNWSPETCVTDDVICNLYSQLPWDTRLVMAFDCCHSGGIHRDAGIRVRGLTPPDDIRHRALRWDAKREMWVARDLPPLNPDFTNDEEVEKQFVGESQSVLRLGRAMLLRGQTQKDYEALKKREQEPVGPYLPMILEACREDQYAYEYRHGVESYGAFTYTLAKVLRQNRSLTFGEAIAESRDRLAELGYDQVPAILGPTALVNSPIPWVEASPPRAKRKSKRKAKRG